MAIKMRTNTKEKAICIACGNDRKRSLDMFDICIGKEVFTICDMCNEKLFNKTLSAECYKNGRVKSQLDMNVIKRRNLVNGQ